MNTGDFSLVKELLINIDKKQDKLAERIQTVREETALRLDHLDGCIDSVRDAVNESNTRLQRMIEDVADAIPNRDYAGHKLAHTTEMQDASTAKELKLEAKKTLIRWLLPIVMLAVCAALFDAAILELKEHL